MSVGPPRRIFDETGRRRRLSILGATGSIGKSTLDIVSRDADAIEIVAVTANGNAEALAQLAVQHQAEFAAIADPAKLDDLRRHLDGTGIRCGAGAAALDEAATLPADCIMAAIVGAAGIAPTVTAARQGTRVALANKECLVSAGDIFMRVIADAGAELVPVDSEHSGALQILRGNAKEAVEKMVLTASGGPFRTWQREAIDKATAAEALRHPNWSMGDKITIDSATLMNKGLELIEAMHLFGIAPQQLDCVVHPQSIVHCLVTFQDGSVLAQLACPDMRTPIAVALAWPDRMDAPTRRLDLATLGSLTFEAPDPARFPALRIARSALERGGSAPAVLNAANEIAVAAFLGGRLTFGGIAALVEETLGRADKEGALQPATDIEGVLTVDTAARHLAQDSLRRYL